MNRDQQIKYIGEFCGWKPCHKGCEGKTWRFPDDSGCADSLPNYLDSLDAMHSAEMVLLGDIGLRNSYVKTLRELDIPSTDFFLVTASASDRAEAFLKTIGMWRE